jgi:hypothetical protein
MKRTTLIAGAIVLLLSASSTLIFAQPSRNGRSANSFQFRIGGFLPDGGGDLWEDNAEVFTLSASDFDDVTVGFSFVRPFSNNFEVGLNVDLYDGTVLSRYADYFDEFDFPIYHDTTLEMVPLTVDVRFLPFGRYRMRHGGRQVLKPVLYVGAGAGVNLWAYEEIGDFIDFSVPELPIFPGRFEDSGAAFETHVLAGVELPLSPSFNLLLEGRYSWSEDTLGEDFSGFGDIDLGGVWINVGGSFRF